LIYVYIGYGNQSPVTFEGRALVYGVGWLCIVLFGGVSWLAGQVITILVDDIFTRNTPLKAFVTPFRGALFWAVISFGWMYVVAHAAYQYWTTRVPDMVVDKGDSIWFSYISTLTVGLGDYYLVRSGSNFGSATRGSYSFLWTLHGRR
jgi:hypothetical protein